MIDEIQERISKTEIDFWTSSPIIIFIPAFDREPSNNRPIQGLNCSTLGIAIRSQSNVAIVDRDSLDYVLREYKLETSDLTNPRASANLGKLLPASILINGIVKSNKYDVTLILQLINVQTTEVIGFLEETIPLESAPSNLLNSMVSRIDVSLREAFPIQGKLLEVQGETGEINIGSYHGIKSGMEVEIREPKEISPAYVRPKLVVVGKGVVSTVTKFNATLKITHSRKALLRGMLVMEPED